MESFSFASERNEFDAAGVPGAPAYDQRYRMVARDVGCWH
jgi:hypothetical protein